MKKNINLDLQKKDYSESKVLIISTKWNEEIIQSMLDDCKETLKILKVNFSEVKVPGAFEIPFMVNNQAKSYDAIITIGAIIKGETPHFDIIAKSISDQIISLGIELNKPVIFGVLTTNNIEQALERSKTKGKELALSALYLLDQLDG